MKLSKKASNEIALNLKKFQGIVQDAKTRDVNESDTVIILTDIYERLLGWNKYEEITSETCIRGTYCDLALKIDGKTKVLIEVKAVGIALKENHIRQAVEYGAKSGVEWVVLTNGVEWQVYKVIFGKPISQLLIHSFDFLSLNHKAEEDLRSLALLSRKGVEKGGLDAFVSLQEATDRFAIGAVLLTDPIINSIRRELRRINPGVKIDADQILETLRTQVLKRDITESSRLDKAKRKVGRRQKRKTSITEKANESAIENLKILPLNSASEDEVSSDSEAQQKERSSVEILKAR